MGKEIVIPVKFHRNLTNEEIDEFVDMCLNFGVERKINISHISPRTAFKNYTSIDEATHYTNKWIPIDEKPIQNKACLCYCPREPINKFIVAYWDEQYGFVDNDEYCYDVAYYQYIDLPKNI